MKNKEQGTCASDKLTVKICRAAIIFSFKHVLNTFLCLWVIATSHSNLALVRQAASEDFCIYANAFGLELSGPYDSSSVLVYLFNTPVVSFPTQDEVIRIDTFIKQQSEVISSLYFEMCYYWSLQTWKTKKIINYSASAQWLLTWACRNAKLSSWHYKPQVIGSYQSLGICQIIVIYQHS